MSNFQSIVRFRSDAPSVYKAITTPEGIMGWWTTDCDVSTQVGGTHSFRFERLLFNSMEVIELEPFNKVHWKCVEGWKEWIGTEVIFTLSENEYGGTDLLFEHRGLTPSLKCYKMCSQGWLKTLKSLQDYVDTGKGKPHVPKTGISGVIARTAFKAFSRQYTK